MGAEKTFRSNDSPKSDLSPYDHLCSWRHNQFYLSQIYELKVEDGWFPQKSIWLTLPRKGQNGYQTRKHNGCPLQGLWFLHMKTRALKKSTPGCCFKQKIKRVVQLLLCSYSPVVFTLCLLNPFHCLCSGSGPTLLELHLNWAVCLPSSLLASGTPTMPYSQINLLFQQSSGSQGATESSGV